MRFFTMRQSADNGRRPVTDGWWYLPAGVSTKSSMLMSPERARTISALYRALVLLSSSIAMAPCHVLERLPGGRRLAAEHPVHDLLQWQPNPWQTAFDFWEMVVGHVLLRGTFYGRMMAGPRGSVHQIVPLHPDRVKPGPLGPRGVSSYTYSRVTGDPEEIPGYDIFRVCGPSDDGITGLSLPSVARESFGLMLATEGYGAALFGQAPAMAGILEYPGTMDEGTASQVARSFREAHSGPDAWHGVAVLEKGMTWKAIGMKAEEAQFLATRQFGVEDVSRWTGVPAHMLAQSKTPTFASIEAFQIEFVLYALMPIAIRIEQAIRRDVIDADRRYYAKFNLGVLMRGDHASRSEFYRKAILDGWMTRNQVRELEDLDPGPEELDRYLEPRNMAEAGSQATTAVGRAKQIAQSAAARLVRKELAAVGKAAERYARDQAGFAQWAADFYTGHAATLVDTLRVSDEVARRYCEQQRVAVEAGGAAALQYWDRLEGWLTRMALGGDVDERALAAVA